VNDCFKENGWDSYGVRKTCCDGMLCIQEDSQYSCKATSASYCEDINAANPEFSGKSAEEIKDICNDAADIGVASVNRIHFDEYPDYCLEASWPEDVGGKQCTKKVENCRCGWDETDNICKGANDFKTYCPNSPPENLGTCVWTSSEMSNCTSGFRMMSWTAAWTPASVNRPSETECNDITKRMPCPVQLPLTSLVGLAIAVVLVILFYLLSLRKKRK
jgi:hypothetical protein